MINILVKVKNVMNKILSAASVVLLVFMTSLVLWQVFTRYVLGKPAAFTEELVKYSLMWTAFIGAAMLSLQEIICHSLLLKISSQVINEKYYYWL